MNEPRGKELVERYKSNYHIPTNASVTEEMILMHWELEKRLTAQLLNSTSQNRWETFEKCYTQLYEQLPWLNELIVTALDPDQSDDYKCWNMLIDGTPKRVYEVGSGKGDLIQFLAQSGHKCVGTDITRKRGRKYAANHFNLTWDITDGVHLDNFVSPESFDIVLSDQVIEHLHPNDIISHFQSIFEILKDGGKYIFRTPHVHQGPSDISKVFRCDRPMGMHLKEYTFAEINKSLRLAGFKKNCAVLRVPNWLQNLFGKTLIPRMSYKYLKYLMIVEASVAMFPLQRMRRSIIGLLRYPLFSTIFLVAEKEFDNHD
jgi:SAM-dependent methyltransferase